MRHTATPATRALLLVLILVTTGPARAIAADDLVLNGGAELGKGDQPSIWFAAQVPTQGLRMWRDTTQARTGQACLAITNQHDYDQPVANNWAQTLQHVPAGKSLQVVAYIKTSDADAANVCLQCWDKSAKTMLAFASTPVVRGDQDWALLRSEPVVIPDATASIIVRAALTGKGEARFDDVAVTLVDPGPTAAEIVPTEKPGGPDGPKLAADIVGVDPELAQLVPGRIVGVRPAIKDQMVLSYIPDWSHGTLDNIAVANNDGGVRTLIAWMPPTPEQAHDPAHRFYLALYSRDTRVGAEPGRIALYRINSEWNEQTSWQKQPQTDPGPCSAAEFTPGKGWKIFELTGSARTGGEKQGLMIRFEKEDRKADNWSGYQFVSREGAGEWKARRPVLLVVEPADRSAPRTQKSAEAPRQ